MTPTMFLSLRIAVTFWGPTHTLGLFVVVLGQWSSVFPYKDGMESLGGRG